MIGRKILPPTWMLVAMLAMMALHFSLPGMGIIPAPWSLAGILLLALGITLTMIADDLFRKLHTTVKPYEESAVLVTSGPYRLSRNPMYLGFVLILTGTAILLGSLTPFLVVLAFVVVIDRVFIQAEERMLARKFGAEWQTYRGKTRRRI
jgi:protein-S-isoprenylcysteine O-methyltransferase Ste14